MADSAFTPPVPPSAEPLASELWRKKAYIAKAFAGMMAFWLLQFAYQYHVLIPGELNGALLRSFALSGATLIGVAVAIGPLAQVFSKHNYIYLRRTFGVSGFTLAFMHVLTVLGAFFNWQVSFLFFELNPYKNPLLFGVAAFLLFLPLYVTSTDWAIKKLSYPAWKTIHRLIYLAYIFTVLHFSQINPDLLYNPAGYLLIAVTVAAFGLELTAFAKKVQSGQAGRGAWIGAFITALALVLFALAFLFKPLVAG